MSATLFTVGHSTHATEHFVGLLQQHGITAVVDVRSRPYSRHNPQYNRETIAATLKQQGIAYVFLGAELGARSENSDCYVGGKVRYEKLAAEPAFLHGLERLRRGMREYQVALMCAEKDPLTCHRTILVARQLRSECAIKHILADGGIETQAEAEARLMKLLKIDPDLARDEDQCIAEAHALQEEKIAYVREQA
ncbi:MAG: DUF488 domain-containing protein [Gammaproteobacteria bacterium]|nr:DUF488 domain-containing protein [Gammaproteobacteria bacterium]